MSNSQPELLIPVSDQGAALQFFVEAMKANTATLQQIGKALQGVQAEQKETLRIINDTRERVIKLESGDHVERVNGLKGEIGKLDTEIVALDKEIRELKSDRDHRKGAADGLTWMLRYGPLVVVIIGAIMLVLNAKGEL